MSESLAVLIADGDEARAKRLAEACAAHGHGCSLALDGSAALERALVESPAALLAHRALPLISGAKLAEILDANPRTRNIAVLLLGEAGPGEAAGEPGISDRDPEAVARRLEALIAEGPAARARPPAAERGGGVEGDLTQIPLADLLELFHGSRRTGTVELLHGPQPGEPERGQVFLRGGNVVQAQIGAVEGEKALFRLLAWDRGRFRFAPGPVGLAARIGTPTRSLLREGRRQLEEWARLTVELPPLQAQVVPRAGPEALPDAIHPLTREVLRVLESATRVRDVVDRCSHPDYQVLRTLHTLIERGLVELRREPELGEGAREAGFLGASGVSRLRESLSRTQVRGAARRDAKLLVLAADAASAERLAQLLALLPGMRLRDPRPGPDDLAPLGRLALAPDLGIELVHAPAAARFAPVWSVAGHGALAVWLPFQGAGPSDSQRAAAAALSQRTRIAYLHLLPPGSGQEAGALRASLSLAEDGPLFLLAPEGEEKARSLLRELFTRALP